jgi:hypothetical protein
MKINEGKLGQSISLEDESLSTYYSQTDGTSRHVMYLGIIFNWRMMWRLYIERNAAKAQVTIHKKTIPYSKVSI